MTDSNPTRAGRTERTPLSLPQRLYLLAYDPDQATFPTEELQFRGQRIRAAALAQLALDGAVGACGDRVVRDSSTTLGNDLAADAFLASTWQAVPVEHPRRWFTVIQDHVLEVESVVRDQLVADGTVDAPARADAWVGGREVTVRAPEEVRQLHDSVRQPVLQDQDPGTVPIDVVATVVLSTTGNARGPLTWQERWKHRRALKAYGARLDSVAPGLRRDLDAAIGTTAAVGGGWGT